MPRQLNSKATGVASINSTITGRWICSPGITKWDHPNVAAINPELAGSAYAGQDIFVVRRELGSSSTSAITEYLHLGCPVKWPANKVGKTITWPSSTNGAQGSDGISNFLNDNPGSIGYVDVGHGHKKNLKEIELKNAHGVYLDSKTADLGAAMEEALKEGLLPPSLDESVHNVKLLNLRGARTWPIVGVSYLYLQKDLTALGQSGALLKAFVEHMLSDEVQGTAEAPGLISEFGFAPVPSAVMELNRQALAMMKLAPGVKEWTTEYADNTLVGAGALEYVMSAKRQSYSLYERKSLKSSLDDNWAAMNADKAVGSGHQPHLCHEGQPLKHHRAYVVRKASFEHLQKGGLILDEARACPARNVQQRRNWCFQRICSFCCTM